MSNLYKPTIADIILVKECFYAVPVSKPLPLELIDQILDYASYWAHSSVTVDWDKIIPDSEMVEDKMYVRTLPLAVYGTQGDVVLTKQWKSGSQEFRLGVEDDEDSETRDWLPPRGEHPCRMIEFNLWSSDQGWSDNHINHGTYQDSYTWFDASVETPNLDTSNSKAVIWPSHLLIYDSNAANLPFEFTRRDPAHPFLPPPTHLQRNIHAQHNTHHHTITWHYLDSIDENSPAAVEADNRGQGWKSLDGSFVRSLKMGDCITLWMRARFPGWKLDAKMAKIDLYWAV